MLNKSLLIAVLSLTPLSVTSGPALAQEPPLHIGTLMRQLLDEKSAPAAQQPWLEYRSAEGGYRVELPAPPTSQTQHIPLADGSNARAMMSESLKGPLAFLASHIAYPAGYLHEDRQRVLESVRNSQLKTRTLVREQRVAVSGVAGLEYVMAAQGSFTVIRSTLVGDRLYQLVVSGGRDANVDKDPDVRRFFASFKLASNLGLP